MKRPSFLTTLIFAMSFLCIVGSTSAADSPPDISKLDPAWAAGELDSSLRDSEMGSAWSAIKAVFPADYARFTRSMAEALISNREWRGLPQQFMEKYLGDNLKFAQHAPAAAQLKYEQQKAQLLQYLSSTNPAACAYLGTGLGDPTSIRKLDPEGTRRYSDLIAEKVKTIGEGRDSPTIFTPLPSERGSQILSVMVAQGTPKSEARKILGSQVGKSKADQCRAGLLKQNALAGAWAEIAAKDALH